ncbi:hypothetical protein DTO013E5_4150 [Penicillium roqueforti]|nr:hypothetical protein DTO012A1_5918 [Penicillium roqueforti]KAI2753974.1 hypothetical protein DTO013F2_2374 [Penicillium roqueforti]KAI2769617.1 hypothetical protein DTO012A8_5430 [Penicillium roqueforti]KAI3080846.1 hypothetical protein CBS147339_3432 [Penicillium roqueforti]KAI3103929.1 hypothetical protein CBS147338_1750 [Penicillium roqueforti]
MEAIECRVHPLWCEVRMNVWFFISANVGSSFFEALGGDLGWVITFLKRSDLFVTGVLLSKVPALNFPSIPRSTSRLHRAKTCLWRETSAGFKAVNSRMVELR